MLFRAFRNSDPPLLVDLWARQPRQRALVSNISVPLLDLYVFSKPYFDRQGLIIAEDETKIAGFVHVGFGPNESRNDISTEMGVTCMLMVAEDCDYWTVAPQLLQKGEEYLRSRGSRLLYGGAIDPLNPFYLGLYGGSELPGVLTSDQQKIDLFSRHGYREIDRCIVMQRDMREFRSPVDRRLIKLRRRYRVELDNAPPSLDWWDACVSPPCEPTRFELFPIDGGPASGNVSFWVMEPMSAHWGVLSVGLTRLVVLEKLQRQGLATFLNSEALRQLQLNGVGIVEVQTMQHNTAAIGLYKKLGFVEVDQGVVFRKEA